MAWYRKTRPEAGDGRLSKGIAIARPIHPAGKKGAGDTGTLNEAGLAEVRDIGNS